MELREKNHLLHIFYVARQIDLEMKFFFVNFKQIINFMDMQLDYLSSHFEMSYLRKHVFANHVEDSSSN